MGGGQPHAGPPETDCKAAHHPTRPTEHPTAPQPLESIPQESGAQRSQFPGAVPSCPHEQHSRYWQRSPMKEGRQRQLGWLPWLTVQLPLLRQ